ncbi:MAG: T9SS type A sorting domain-containing protein [Bacteroidota bacterium]
MKKLVLFTVAFIFITCSCKSQLTIKHFDADIPRGSVLIGLSDDTVMITTQGLTNGGIYNPNLRTSLAYSDAPGFPEIKNPVTSAHYTKEKLAGLMAPSSRPANTLHITKEYVNPFGIGVQLNFERLFTAKDDTLLASVIVPEANLINLSNIHIYEDRFVFPFYYSSFWSPLDSNAHAMAGFGVWHTDNTFDYMIEPDHTTFAQTLDCSWDKKRKQYFSYTSKQEGIQYWDTTENNIIRGYGSRMVINVYDENLSRVDSFNLRRFRDDGDVEASGGKLFIAGRRLHPFSADNIYHIRSAAVMCLNPPDSSNSGWNVENAIYFEPPKGFEYNDVGYFAGLNLLHPDSSGGVYYGFTSSFKQVKDSSQIPPTIHSASAFSIARVNNAGELVWQRDFGGDADYHLTSMTVGTDGAVYGAGSVHDWRVNGDGKRDIFILKLDPDGNVITSTHEALAEPQTTPQLFPNPAHTTAHLRWPSLKTGFTYRVTDALGRTHLSGRSTTPELALDVSALSSGLYFVVVQVGDQRHTLRLVRK